LSKSNYQDWLTFTSEIELFYIPKCFEISSSFWKLLSIL